MTRRLHVAATPARQSAEAAALAAAVARTYLEVEAGRRPLEQLAPLLAPALRARLHACGRQRAPGPPADAIVSVTVVATSADAREAAVVVRRGRRVEVLALRLERHRGGWRLVELSWPDGQRTRTSSLPWAPPPPDAFDEAEAEEAAVAGRGSAADVLEAAS